VQSYFLAGLRRARSVALSCVLRSGFPPFFHALHLLGGWLSLSKSVEGLVGVVGRDAVAWVTFMTVFMQVACGAPLMAMVGRDAGVHSHSGEWQGRPRM
jgi:hypothetical protein